MNNHTVLLYSPEALFPEYQEERIKEIWPDPYRVPAAEAFKADWYTGEVKLIVIWDECANCYMEAGVTGYFFDPEAPNDVYLRWTGVELWARRRNVATEAMNLLIQEIRDRFPERKRLIELVPDNEYGRDIALPFFLKYGFVKDDAFVPSAEKTEWDCIPYVYQLTQ